MPSGVYKRKKLQTKEERLENKRKSSRKYAQRPDIVAKRRLEQSDPEWRKKNSEKAKLPENRKKRRNYELTPERKRKIQIRDLKLKHEICSVYSKRLSNSDIPCCNCCGMSDHLDFLDIDHINPRKTFPENERKLMGSALCRHLKKKNYPDGYQILCKNCNTAKGMKKNNNKCPHEIMRQEKTFAMMEEQSSFEV